MLPAGPAFMSGLRAMPFRSSVGCSDETSDGEVNPTRVRFCAYSGSAYGITVLRPSLPPPRLISTSTLSVAAAELVSARSSGEPP